jgi:stage II sporulation protein D
VAIAVAAMVLLFTCAYPEPGGVVSQGGGSEPELRVGLATGADHLGLASDSEVTLLTAEGTPVPGAPPSVVWTVLPDAGGIAVVHPSGWRSPPYASLTFVPTSPVAPLYTGDRPYRGRIVVFRDPTGLTAVNRLGLEAYLAGVLSAEMGRRESSEDEALAAQAVVSRTFAVRNLGKRQSEGFDLNATVADQVYGGIMAETPQAWKAVRETSGQILTYHKAPIDAFFFSTCGGRTANGSEVFANGGRPYLRSIRDEDETGLAYCRISPRFRWREEWTAGELATILQRTLPGVAALREPVESVRSVRVVQRTASDRVARIDIALGRQEVSVEGPAIRRVLHPPADQILRSSAFTLTETRTEDRLTRLVADGSGSGHGVGFCQWGAVGRARAGQSYTQILAAYFQGTEIERLY